MYVRSRNLAHRTSVVDSDPEKADRTRRNIVEVALGEFALRGFNGARVDSIAQLTSTSKRMIYYHFGGKEGLYIAVLADACLRRLEQTEVPGLDQLPPLQALAAIVRSWFDFDLANPDLVRLGVEENIHRAMYLANVAEIEELRIATLAPVQLVCRRGIACGAIRQEVDAIDLLMSVAALCSFQVANLHTFATLHRADMTSEAAVQTRRENVVSVVLDFVAVEKALARSLIKSGGGEAIAPTAPTFPMSGARRRDRAVTLGAKSRPSASSGLAGQFFR